MHNIRLELWLAVHLVLDPAVLVLAVTRRAQRWAWSASADREDGMNYARR